MKQLMNNMNNGLFKLIHNCQIDKPDQHWNVETELKCLKMIKVQKNQIKGQTVSKSFVDLMG